MTSLIPVSPTLDLRRGEVDAIMINNEMVEDDSGEEKMKVWVNIFLKDAGIIRYTVASIKVGEEEAADIGKILGLVEYLALLHARPGVIKATMVHPDIYLRVFVAKREVSLKYDTLAECIVAQKIIRART